MALRFWRRIATVVPGVTLNLSKIGLSVTLGVKGARLTLGKKGHRKTVGLPGTGVSYTEPPKKSKRMEVSLGLFL